MSRENGLVKQVRQAGVVGAGGAGFPTYVKLQRQAEYLLLNGAECEPLLHKDKELMKGYSKDLVNGMAMLRDYLGAKEAIIAIKDKYQEVIKKIEAIAPAGVRVHQLGDYYPAGDEFVVVYEAVGRVVPRGGLPLHVGCVVMNIETLLNIVWEQPVTDTYLTVAGAVQNPITVKAPVGMTVRQLVQAAGGVTVEPYAVLSGGVMMGKLVTDLDAPVTKTTGGLLVFPDDHNLIRRYRQDYSQIHKIGKSACDQCSFCTELCPRYLLGHPIEPHLAMRSLVYSQGDKTPMVHGTHFCCECNICSLIACPEDLDPKNVCAVNKRKLKEEKVYYPEDAPSMPVHPMREGRKTPVSRLFAKLGLNGFENKGPMTPLEVDLPEVKILLQQHVGAPGAPTVKRGDNVKKGDMIANVASDQLGVPVHASINGKVAEVTDSFIRIERG